MERLCVPLYAGALRPIPAKVWRDVRSILIVISIYQHQERRGGGSSIDSGIRHTHACVYGIQAKLLRKSV